MDEFQVLKPTDKRLRMVCEPVSQNELRSKVFQQLIEIMLDFVYGTNSKGESRKRDQAMTVGLSANQIGILKRISVVDLAIGHKDFSDLHVLINPEIIWSSKGTIERNEGCVNLDNIWGYVTRSKRVKVRALDRSGNKIELDLKGWAAVLLQHEIDHLQGKLFIDHLQDPTQAHLVEAADYRLHKNLKKDWKKFVDVSELIRH